MFHLSVWTYLAVCVYVAATCAIAWRRGEARHRFGGTYALVLLVVATVYTGFALGKKPPDPRDPMADYTFIAVGDFLAIMATLFSLGWTIRRFGLAPLLSIAGGIWLFLLLAHYTAGM